jgi:hypothetical protein
VVLLGAEWKTRALIRAQLIEEGFEVVATDTWPMMRRHLRPGLKPRLAVVDLKDLDEPGRVLRDLAVLMKPERVFALTAARHGAASRHRALAIRSSIGRSRSRPSSPRCAQHFAATKPARVDPILRVIPRRVQTA